MRYIRLLPILMVVCTAVLSLKLLGLFEAYNAGTLRLIGVQPLQAQEADGDGTAQMANAAGAETDSSTDQEQAGISELNILSSLRERRETLEEREKSLQLRENLLSAAEQRLESRIEELEALESRLKAAAEAEIDARKDELSGLVTMYETMKPKEAARIFERLPSEVLLEMVGQMNPRKMSSILASMSPDAAQRLTTEMTRRNQAVAEEPFSDLPKIGE